MGVVRPVGHEERLSIVDHLDELRTRLIWCIVAFIISFSVCYSQNHRLLRIVNRPLQSTQNLDGKKRSKDPLEESARFAIRSGAAQKQAAEAIGSLSRYLATSAPHENLSPREQAALRTGLVDLNAAATAQQDAPAPGPTNPQRQPVTLGVTEPFVTTFTVSAYAALLLSLPIILWQGYAVVPPAVRPAARRGAPPPTPVGP